MVNPRKPKCLMNGVCRTHVKTCLYDPLWWITILCDPLWSFMHDLYGMILKSHFKTPFFMFRPSLARHFRQKSCLAAWQWGARGARFGHANPPWGASNVWGCVDNPTMGMGMEYVNVWDYYIQYIHYYFDGGHLTKTVHWEDDDDDELEGIEVVGMRWNGLLMEHSTS